MSVEFARWLRAQMRERDWTQADLSRKLDISSGTISHWFQGDRNPVPESCIRLAEVLLVNPDTVLVKAGHKVTSPEWDADDPRAIMHSLIDRIAWTPDRIAMTQAMLRQMRRTDLEQAAQGAGEGAPDSAE